MATCGYGTALTISGLMRVIFKVLKESKAKLGHKALLERLGFKVFRVTLVLRDHKASKAKQVPLARKVMLVYRAFKVIPDHKAYKV
jgi:hypothetical protein